MQISLPPNPPTHIKYYFAMWSNCEGGFQLFEALRFRSTHTAWAEQREQEGGWWREKAEEVHCHGGGESLDAEANARVWRLLEKEEKTGMGARLPTIPTQGGVSGRLEEHMAVGH